MLSNKLRQIVRIKPMWILRKLRRQRRKLVLTSLFLLISLGPLTFGTFKYLTRVKGAAACPVSDGGAGDADATVNGVIVIGANTTWTAETQHEGVIDCTGVDITVNSGVTLTFNMANDGDEDYTEDYGLTLQTDNLTVEGTVTTNGKGYAGGNSSHPQGWGPGGGYTGTNGTGADHGRR